MKSIAYSFLLVGVMFAICSEESIGQTMAAKAGRPKIALQQTDGSKCHPQRPGSCLNICIFFATMTVRSPVDATHVLADVKPEDVPFLQKVAWETVQKYVNPLPTLPIAQ
ncbi:MAG: hypothetical protein WCD79_03015 [Chthoniobacteraceae bacterium]